MSREPIRDHRSFQQRRMPSSVLRDIRRRFQRLSPCHGQVAHVFRTLSPVAARVLLPRSAPRLACVKPAASVHPEPGSNSSLYIHYKFLAYPDAPLILFVDGCLRFPSRLGHDPKVAPVAAQAPSLPSTKIICGPFLFYKESTLSIYLVLGTCLYFPSSLFNDLFFFVYFADACVVLPRRSVTTIRSLTRASVRRLGLNKISQRTVPRGA